jgi:hypothetical protein
VTLVAAVETLDSRVRFLSIRTREQAMTEESISQAADTNQAPAETGGQQESASRTMLRGAIQKVMDEIELHEREARHHLHQAGELRKELRESLAFLHEQSEKKTPGVPRARSQPEAAGTGAEEKSSQSVTAKRRRRGRRK